jgi:ATP-binding cassette subfamily B (MDR/TAP) protein 1
MGPEMGKATSAAAAIFKIIEYPSEINAIAIDEDTSAKKILNTDDIKGKIEFRNVWFRYPTRKQDFVLKGLQLTINPGEQVALVGESGCGKSTFINLLMRFYDPDFGEVLLDDVNIKEYNLHDLRKGISLVMQEPIIFNYSILENILYGKLDAKNSEILDATNLANATEFIEGNNGFQLDDNIMNLKAEMEKNKDLIVDMIGEEKYKEELEVMKKLVEQEGAKGVF